MIFGIIGCGNIGTELALFLDNEEKAKKILLYDKDTKLADKLNGIISKGSVAHTTFDLILNSDIIIECAHPEIVSGILEKAVDNKKELIILSVGGLIGKEHLIELAKKNSVKVHIPTGAIGGLDAIKAVKGKIKSLTLTTTKPPAGLDDAPHITKNNINLKEITEKKTVFEGSVEEAVKGFPKNINVAATLRIHSGFKDLKIKIIADPNTKTNTHSITAEGDFGKITTICENKPSPNNPKTSYLAILSAISILKEILS